jgi:hypothetical protein
MVRTKIKEERNYRQENREKERREGEEELQEGCSFWFVNEPTFHPNHKCPTIQRFSVVGNSPF